VLGSNSRIVMKIIKYIAAALLISSSAAAHEMTPTYVEFKPSYVDGVYVTTINLWNRRNDVEYYEISVLDQMWKKIAFATRDRIIKIPHLSKEKIDIYIKQDDIEDVEFICTSSKQLKSDVKSTGVRSMICSRIER
jgi:hypothetical protein